MTNLTETWINIYKHKNSYWCGNPYHTKTEALLYLADTENYLTTVNIKQLLKLQEENTKLKEKNEYLQGILNTLNDINKIILKKLVSLKNLLKECKEYFENMSPDFDSHDFDEIISKTDQALANNKIKVNTVACNKIQENK